MSSWVSPGRFRAQNFVLLSFDPERKVHRRQPSRDHDYQTALRECAMYSCDERALGYVNISRDYPDFLMLYSSGTIPSAVITMSCCDQNS